MYQKLTMIDIRYGWYNLLNGNYGNVVIIKYGVAVKKINVFYNLKK